MCMYVSHDGKLHSSIFRHSCLISTKQSIDLALRTMSTFGSPYMGTGGGGGFYPPPPPPRPSPPSQKKIGATAAETFLS